MSDATDLLGHPLTGFEHALMRVYEDLKALLDHADLAPCASANIKDAVATLWNVVNDLALTDDRPDV